MDFSALNGTSALHFFLPGLRGQGWWAERLSKPEAVDNYKETMFPIPNRTVAHMNLQQFGKCAQAMSKIKSDKT